MSTESDLRPAPLPEWARELIHLYESGAATQFVLYGNVNDRLLLPLGGKPEVGMLTDFLLRVLLPRFDIVLSYDLGNGIRVEQGGPLFSQWPRLKENPQLPREPRAAIETLTHFFRYSANLARLGQASYQIGCIVKGADFVTPSLPGGSGYDLSATALLIRDWCTDSLLAGHSLATFLISENLNDLHSILANNTRAARVKVPLPAPEELRLALEQWRPRYPVALGQYAGDLTAPAAQLAGATLSSVEGLLKSREHARAALTPADLVKLKKSLVEADCSGLIEFIESDRTLDDLYGLEQVKEWLRQDLQLWEQNDLAALPMGYLFCGPVGTGKTFLVECWAGEAGVPVVKFGNFRDRWVGSTEGNLEKIFRLLQALGRCIVFIDEADQALGRRDSGTSDSGLSGRVYSMISQEMSDTRNRGRILWVLASSRPDLIEVDLKRPGRVDVKIPLFPTTTPEESFHLLQALCRRRQVALPEDSLPELRELLPLLLTPGAAEALAVKIYRLVRTRGITPAQAARACLEDYQPPVPEDVMQFQIELARREATDVSFIPAALRR